MLRMQGIRQDRSIPADPTNGRPESWQMCIRDRPNTYIDKRFEAKLYSLLEEINKERAIILVSHDIGTPHYQYNGIF